MTKQEEQQIIKKYKDKSREELIRLYNNIWYSLNPIKGKLAKEIKIALKYRGVKTE